MSKVSVIIPCYNVEKYLRQCLDSVVNQTLKDIEIICVNDGSTDGSLAILNEYANKDSRIKIINKENSGYGASMNIGLDNATGEYIGIVESDDFAKLDMFERLYELAKKYDVEIAKGDWYSYYGQTDTLVKNNHFIQFKEESILIPEIDKDIFVIPALIASSIYKKTFLQTNNIRFLETPGASFQDTSFAATTIIATNKLVLTKENYYCYRVDNQNSSVKSKQKTFFICDEYEKINNFIEKFPNKKASLEEHKCANQFREYLWNFNRLEKKESKKFLKRFREEFNIYYDNNILKNEFYSRYSKEQLLCLLNNASLFFARYYNDNLPKRKNRFITIDNGVLKVYIAKKKVFSTNFVKHFSKFVNKMLYIKCLQTLKKIMKNVKNDKVFVMTPFIPYHSPLKQRFQHIAENLSQLGYLVFYCTEVYEDKDFYDKNWFGFKKINENLYLCDNLQLLQSHLNNAWFYYTPIQTFSEKSFYNSKKFNKIIYDHIDSFKVGDLKGKNIAYNRHKKIVNDCDIILYSAQGLLEDFDETTKKTKPLYLVNNGTDYNHFALANSDEDIIKQFETIKENKEYIVGYYGAIAHWIDFDLLKKVITKMPNVLFIFIGQTYTDDDELNLAKLSKLNNCEYIDAIPYDKLPQYANLFDICLLPFKEGEIAQYTNPIKLFEYMSMGKPVVATKDLKECYGFDGVYITENKVEDFIENIELAYQASKNTAIIRQLQQYAKNNTWDKNCKKIADILTNYNKNFSVKNLYSNNKNTYYRSAKCQKYQ